MIVDLRSILDSPRHFDLTLEADWWQGGNGDDQILGLDGPLVASFTMSKTGTKYFLEGRLRGRFRIKCDRCLESYPRDVEDDFRIFLAPGPLDTDQSEVELLEEDLSVDFVTDEGIDLEEIIREQVYLSLPIKSLCRQDCSGLCPICGTDLNKKNCGCRREEGHPGFSKLKGLKLKGD